MTYRNEKISIAIAVSLLIVTGISDFMMDRLQRELATCRQRAADAAKDAAAARFLWQQQKAVAARCVAAQDSLAEAASPQAIADATPRGHASPADPAAGRQSIPAAESASQDYTVITEPAPLTAGRQLAADAARLKYPALSGLAAKLLRSTESAKQQAAQQPVFVLRGRVPVTDFAAGAGAAFWYYDARSRTWSGPFAAEALQ